MEIWKKLTCFEINPEIYEISNHGRIRHNITHELIPMYYHRSGKEEPYMAVSLITIHGGYCNYLVHRLVAATFILFRHSSRIQVNHKDSNRLNNHIDNLEWVTPLENTRHAMEHGNFPFCEDRYNAKFTNEQVHYICKLLEEGKMYNEILNLLGIEITENNLESIGNIKRRITYTKISSGYDFSKYEYNNSNYTNEQIIQICEYIKQGLDYRQIANLIGRDISTRRQRKTFADFICRIRNKRSFKEITQNYEW